jgi:hypothetical protein
MNEILISPPRRRRRGKTLVKRLVWSAANSCALGGLYAWRLEKHWLRIERRQMPLPNLGQAFCGAKLAHISDIHCCLIVRERYLRQCVEEVNRLEADFVAITGDFITGAGSYARRIARILRGLAPKVAVLACLGNHDYGILHPRGLGGRRELAETVAGELGSADIFVMMNEPRVFRRGKAALQFVGLEDYWSPRYDPGLAFEAACDHLPTIALCHNPDAAPELARHGADWVLAGHTHGTAVDEKNFPEALLPTEQRHFAAGEYALGPGQYLYVNRGLGYGRRTSLNSRPEITVFSLQRT